MFIKKQKINNFEVLRAIAESTNTKEYGKNRIRANKERQKGTPREELDFA